MNKDMEVWRDVPGYEGYYQVSSLGRVRSLDRTVTTKHGVERFYKGRIIKGNVNGDGYRQTTLKKNNIGRAFLFSQVVAMTFLGHEPNGNTLVVDHINGDRSDDRVDNLRIVTNRANATTCFRSDRGSFTSTYVGVYWAKSSDRWGAQIQHNGVGTGLGYYDTEIEASKAYQLALSKIKDGSFNPNDYKPKLTSKYKGVCFHKASNKWMAYITINGKRKHIGLFKTELEAHHAYLKAEKEQKSA
ncbi:MAG TPA: hypothetical protein GX707_11520 [Epulopiscium sp.]|nr:hypothetical protein [Candidatus Epulonipiscium sp.]